MTTDLIARLRHAHEHSQQRIVGSNIFQEAATALEAQEANAKQLADTIRDMHAAGLELRQRAEQAERALAEAVEVLRPFAEIREALELISANKPGDVLQDERAIFQTWGLKDTPTSRQITLGHLRAARQFAKGYHAMLQAAQGGDDD